MPRQLLLLAFVILSFVIRHSAHAAPLSGTKSVGPTGDYASLTAAIADVQTQTLGGALILELQPAYLGTVETFPLTVPALNGASAVNTLTIRPAAGATALAISSADTTAATVDLQGAQFVTFDGRPGGAGTAKELTIENTSTAGVALRFINEASGNTLKFVTFKGVNASGVTGTVFFSTTTGANGNDNNTIDTCDIGDGATTPAVGIYSRGSNGTTAQYNSGNTVSNCNVFNFYATVTSGGIWLDGPESDWTISGNSLYQTASRAAVGAFMRGIYMRGNTANITGNIFTITGNFIGGSAPNCGGTAWTTTGTGAAYRFSGIEVAAGTTTASSVQGNTIANIVWTSSNNATALPGVWTGIYASSGNVNIGTVTANAIGSGTGTGSISVTTSGSGGTTFGIGSASSGTVAIASNTIGSITANGSSGSISASLIGISVTAGTNSISSNTVGSTTTANSLNAATSSNSATAQQVTGILSTSTTSASITGNTVANLNNNYNGSSTGGQIRGIFTSAGVNSIIGNTVRNLATTSLNANNSMTATTGQSVVGIAEISATAGQTVSQNTVHSIANASFTSSGSVTGIYYTGSTSGTNLIARNFVHSIANSTSSSVSPLHGIQVVAGAFTVQNNMVRIGLMADGTSTAVFSTIRGIYENGASSGRNFYHNSVYIGGTQATGAALSAAFVSGGISNTRDFRNNIFFNARSNGSGATAKHYAVYFPAGTDTVNLTMSNNLYLATGTGGVLGYYNGGDLGSIDAWQASTGRDANSLSANPLFVSPAGTAATVNLHLGTGSPAETAGTPIASVADDFDGQTRNAVTPDIGADDGDFGLGISLPALSSGSTASRVLTGWATITSPTGVSTGANAPRLYFKKSSENDAFVGNTSANNGWKYVTASNSSSPYSFTVDYSLLTGGGVAAGNTIQYFVVAQNAGQFRSVPYGATTSGSSVQNVSAKPTHGVLSYSIVDTISGTVTVGSGGNFPSLSGAGGLFSALNSRVLTGNVTVNLISDTTENGSVLLNALIAGPNYPAPTYTVTLQPDSATMRTISGSSANGLITLNGADNVTIDGRFGGSGRYLTFRNTNTVNTASTIRLQNDSSNNTIRNCVVEGCSIGGRGVMGVDTGAVTGNDNNLITANQIRDRSDAAGVPYALFATNGTLAAGNSNNVLSNNELFNFNTVGIAIGNQGDEGWTISGNNIYEVNPATGSSLRGMDFGSTGTNLITGNYVHDLVTTGNQSIGIFFQAISNTTISGNRITAFNVNAATTDVRGITPIGSAGSTVNIVNNQITLIPATSGSVLLGGIYDNGTSGTVVNAFYNSIVIGGTETGSRNSWGSFRMQTDTHTSRNNLFLNLRTGGTGSHFAAGNEGSGGTYTASNNVYAGTGSTAANFMDFGTSATTPVSFATWQSGTGDNGSSASNPGGNYSAAMFVSAPTGNLHLVTGGNVLVNNTGTPVAGITTDYDGETRSSTAPYIGADEILPLSSNADLAALTLSAGTLNTAFDANTLAYTLTVPNGTTNTTVTATRAEANATLQLQLNGGGFSALSSGAASSAQALNVGANTLDVKVTAQDGTTTKTYTVTVTRESPPKPTTAPIAYTLNGVPADTTTNNAAPDATGTASVGLFDTVMRGGYLAENGTVAFPAQLDIGTGSPPVTINDFQGMWKDDGTGLKLLARSGSPAPGANGAVFDVLPLIPAISDAGHVSFYASLRIGTGSPAVSSTIDTALWTEVGGTGLQLLAREGDAVPVVPGAHIAGFASGVFATATLSPNTGTAAYSVTLGGITTDTAILRSNLNGGTISHTIVAREHSPAPGTPDTFYNVAGGYSDPCRMDAQGNLCFAAFTSTFKEGIWYQPVGGALTKVVVTGETAPGTGGATFYPYYLSMPAMGGNGTLAFHAFLNADGDNSAGGRSQGIWRGNTTDGFTCILRLGDTNVIRPGLGLPAGAKVGYLAPPWLSNANHAATLAFVDMNGDGTITLPPDKVGLFADTSGTMKLVVKEDDAAPGIADATFVRFDPPVIGGVEQMAFIGFVSGTGITAGTNDSGVWREGPNGGALTLLMRTGDTMVTASGTKTIYKLDIPGSTLNGYPSDHRWEQTVMDGTGRLVINVIFTDGSTSQVLAQ